MKYLKALLLAPVVMALILLISMGFLLVFCLAICLDLVERPGTLKDLWRL